MHRLGHEGVAPDSSDGSVVLELFLRQEPDEDEEEEDEEEEDDRKDNDDDEGTDDGYSERAQWVNDDARTVRQCR